MPNQPLDAYVENLRHRLRFLPQAEREEEVAEFRHHLQERLSAYENAGEIPEQALNSALHKWGSTGKLVRALRYRWLRRKLDHPVPIALFLLAGGQYLAYGLSVLLYQSYRLFDPAEYLGIVRLFPLFPGSLQPPPHRAGFLYLPLLLAVHLFSATGTAVLLSELRLTRQAKGVSLYIALHFLIALYYDITSLGQIQSLVQLLLLALYQSYYPLITLLVLRVKKPRTLIPFQGTAA